MDNLILGRTIKDIRLMTKAECDEEGWGRPATVIELDNGTIIYSSGDDEGNYPGTFIGKNGNDYFYLIGR